MPDQRVPFIDALNGTLTDADALAGALPANLRAAADFDTEIGDAVQTALDLKASKGANSDITSLAGLTTPLSVGQGGTGTTSLASLKTAMSFVKADVGLGNVDNTSDANKPISTLTQAALDLLAPLASPALTGTPTAPTASGTTNTTQIATTAMVQAALAAYIAAQDVLVFKGGIDCSANPNYPAADAGHVYKVSVAGKIGGASGTNVEVGDVLTCTVDSSSAGTQAAVGANWIVSQVNIDGAVTGPTSATDAAVAGFNGTTGKIIMALSASQIQTAASLSTSDSPQFAGINLGHATDTTFTRVSAGLAAIEGSNILMAGTADQVVTGGATVTSLSLGTVSSGTTTLDMGDRPLQHYTNNGAHTLAPGTPTGSILLDITNGASAGAITTSGFTKVSGDSFTTTNGHKFRCAISVGNGGSLLQVQALQ